MPATSVIVTNWNGKEWLAGCFEALQTQTCTDFEIIFVDDGSTDGSVDWVAQNFPDVKLIPQKPHVGFAAANNIGIRVASGQNIVTLNNDTRPQPDWLQGLVNGLNAPDVGMVASKMLIMDRPEILDSTGIEVDWMGFGWNKDWGRPAIEADTPCDVFGPCAGAALYRREMLDQIGLFDEDFYAYYEDVDLAWRARRAGWRCRFAPGAQVLHKHSGTGRKFTHKKVFLLNRNKIWTLTKNYDWQIFLWAWSFILLSDAASAIFQTLRTRSWVPLQARLEALRGIGKMLSKRNRNAQRVKLAPLRFNISR